MILNARTPTEQAVSGLHTLLESICAKPSQYAKDAALNRALSRQDRLGAYESLAYNVTSSSRSSIERVCGRLLPGGYAKFNALRIEALTHLNAVKAIKEMPERPPKRTREQYRSQAAEQTSVATQRLVDCWHLTCAIHRALAAGRTVVKLSGNAAVIERWNREEEVILAMLTLSKDLVVRLASAEEKWAEELRCIRC